MSQSRDIFVETCRLRENIGTLGGM